MWYEKKENGGSFVGGRGLGWGSDGGGGLGSGVGGVMFRIRGGPGLGLGSGEGGGLGYDSLTKI